ncbi:MAG TPA: DinB family protein [Bacteroidota bacterium]|nr:DinB family protein [Bacteroidota bacterium]
MTQIEIFRELYRHMEWADAAVWRAVLAQPAAASDEKILKFFYHLHLTQRAFLRLWQGAPRETPYPEFTEAPPMMAWGKSWFPEAFAFLATVTDEKLAPPMPVPWSKMVERRIGRPPGETTLGDTILQVAMHSQYHRGQINARLKELGGAPPLVDYIGWIWHGKPGAEWAEE